MSQSLNALRARARNLKLMAFDVDGVMTDGRLYYGPEGETFKVFHTLDGHGLKMLAAAGVTLAIITGRNSEMVARREIGRASCRERVQVAEGAGGLGDKRSNDECRR